MTNRPDLLDEALTRPGRIELKIEIGLPDNAGRQQILHIHTGPLVRNKFLEPDVDIAELADRTKNFTGAAVPCAAKTLTAHRLARFRARALGGGDAGPGVCCECCEWTGRALQARSCRRWCGTPRTGRWTRTSTSKT